MAAERKSALLAIRSDALRTVLNLRDALPFLRELPRVVQIVDVLDASAVQREVRWRLRSRKDPTARSGLHEAIDSGVVIAVAPTFLKQEIEKYLPQIASDTGVSEESARIEWEHVQRMIRFYEPNGDGAEFDFVDPKDSPYAQTAKELDADFVHTTDLHFSQMGVTVIGPDTDVVLREYARSTSIVVTVQVGSYFALTLGGEFLAQIVRAVATLIQKLPPAAKLILGVGAAFALLHPDSRRKLIESVSKVWERVKDSEAVQDGILALGEAMTDSITTGKAIKSKLRVRRQTALSHARLVCLRSREPLSADEIARRILANGYESRSKTFGTYVRRLLKGNSGFTVNAEGLWTIGIAG